jgi:hypothetical protein
MSVKKVLEKKSFYMTYVKKKNRVELSPVDSYTGASEFVFFTQGTKNIIFRLNLCASIEYPDTCEYFICFLLHFEICFQTVGSHAPGSRIKFIVTLSPSL